MPQDEIYLKNLTLTAIVGPDAWQRPGKPQPVSISVNVAYDLSACAAKDDVSKTLNYGQLSKDVTACFSARGKVGFENLLFAAEEVLDVVEKFEPRSGWVTIELPKGLLRGGTLGVRRQFGGSEILEGNEIWARGVRVACIVGVNPHERVERQEIVLGIRAPLFQSEDEHSNQEDFQNAVRRVGEVSIFLSFLNSPISLHSYDMSLTWPLGCISESKDFQ